MDNSYGQSFQTPAWTLKIRSVLSQFSDIFSEFGKYIAPAYYHDRCERSVQMRLYALHKRQFVLVFIIFFACFGLSVFIGLAGPPITVTIQQNATSLIPKPNKSQLATGPLYLKTPAMTTYSQQLWLIAKFISADTNEDHKIEIRFCVNISIRGINDKNKSRMLYQSESGHNRTRSLHCIGQNCDEIIILHLGFLDYTHYVFTLYFYKLEDEKFKIEEIMFYFKHYNPSFTQIEIWFRFVFVVLTFLVTCWFVHSLRHFELKDWSIEEKWMAILLPLLLLYNDPLLPLTFLVYSWIPGMLDAIFQASFLCALLLFWLCIYHGIRQNERHLVTFYLPKLILVGLLWIAAFTLASWQKYNELQDPTFNYQLDSTNFFGFKVFFFVVVAVYLLYLLYLIIIAYSELRSMPYFDMRLKFMTALMLFVLSVSITITVLRFGVSVLQDNFVANLSTNYKSSVEFMAFYGLLNFYLYTMTYVYSPSKNAVFETHYKDNPTFSMLNDSDEDVIYGSEQDDGLLKTSVKATIDSDDD